MAARRCRAASGRFTRCRSGSRLAGLDSAAAARAPIKRNAAWARREVGHFVTHDLTLPAHTRIGNAVPIEHGYVIRVQFHSGHPGFYRVYDGSGRLPAQTGLADAAEIHWWRNHGGN